MREHVLFGEIGQVRLQGQGEGIAVIGCAAEPMYQATHRPGSSALVAVIPGAGLHPATASSMIPGFEAFWPVSMTMSPLILPVSGG